MTLTNALCLVTTGALVLGGLPGCSTASHSPARSRPDRVYSEDTGPSVDAADEIGDLPCDIASLVVTRCIVCHGVEPTIDAHSLLSAADFRAASDVDPSRQVGAIAIERMRGTDLDRMPPAPGAAVPEADIATFEAWVNAGMPSGSCGVADPFDVPPQCTSGSRWLFGERESANMEPGQACIACHTRRRLRLSLSLAGTIYPTAHEPDDCNAALDGPITVEVTDAAGQVLTLSPTPVGNFGTTTHVTFPITARAISPRGYYEMTTAVNSGDCNGCHTQDGTSTEPAGDPPPVPAPGRIIAP